MTGEQRTELMGKVVTVYTEFVRMTKCKFFSVKKYWERFACTHNPWKGWIVGFRWIQDGEIGKDGEWIKTCTKPSVLVARHPTEKPVNCPLDGFVLGDTAYVFPRKEKQ